MSARLCSIEGCEKPHKSTGWCAMHYWRWRKHGDPLKMLRPNYGSGRRITPAGYIEVWVPGHPVANADGYALEHRYVMYELGHDVAGMHVHHLDHDKGNNDASNLAILTPEEHSAHHDEPNAGWFQSQTRCRNGHEFTPETTYVQPNGSRTCRICKAARNRRRYQASRQAVFT